MSTGKFLHLSRIPFSEAEQLIRSVNARLADCLSGMTQEVRRKKSGARQSAKSVYLAKYTFGKLLISPRRADQDDYLGGFVPPCLGTATPCGACKALWNECSNDWPLFIVLNNTVEEFLVDWDGDSKPRVAPTRLLVSGQILGLSEVLNQLTDSAFPKHVFRSPVRSACAGIRSVYVTAPMGNKQLKDSLKAMKLKVQGKPSGPDLWNSDWDDWGFLRAASEVALEASKSSWAVQVIIIPLLWLRSTLYSQGEVKPRAKDFLLQLFEMAWKESRGLRSESIRQITLSQTARGIQGNTNADLIVQRLLLILRGDAPGFRPAMLSDERFPMTAIWQLLLGDERLRQKFFPDKLPDIKFPGFIEPFSLDRRSAVAPGTFFYYPLTSFEQLGYSGRPEDEIETMEQLDALLKRIKRENPELLGSVNWQFFASPEPLKDKTGCEIPRVTTVNFSPAHSSEIILSDFSEQLRSAAKFMSASPEMLLSKRPRKGFLRRFIRMSFD